MTDLLDYGTLIIILCKGKNLPNRRTLGKQNPYCIARVAHEARSSPPDIRGGQIPKWDHEVRFNLRDNPEHKTLKLTVLDKNDSKPELIGDAVLDLQPVFNSNPRDGYDKWHELTFKGKYAGEVYLEMTFYPTKPNIPPKIPKGERTRKKSRPKKRLSDPTPRSFVPADLPPGIVPAGTGSFNDPRTFDHYVPPSYGQQCENSTGLPALPSLPNQSLPNHSMPNISTQALSHSVYGDPQSSVVSPLTNHSGDSYCHISPATLSPSVQSLSQSRPLPEGAVERSHPDIRYLDARMRDPRLAGSRTSEIGITDQRISDPRTVDHRLTDPRMPNARIQDPRISDPRIADLRRSVVDPRMSEPRMSEPRMPDPGMPDHPPVDRRSPDPRLSDPRMSDSRMSEPRLPELPDTRLIHNRVAPPAQTILPAVSSTTSAHMPHSRSTEFMGPQSNNVSGSSRVSQGGYTGNGTALRPLSAGYDGFQMSDPAVQDIPKPLQQSYNSRRSWGGGELFNNQTQISSSKSQRSQNCHKDDDDLDLTVSMLKNSYGGRSVGTGTYERDRAYDRGFEGVVGSSGETTYSPRGSTGSYNDSPRTSTNSRMSNSTNTMYSDDEDNQYKRFLNHKATVLDLPKIPTSPAHGQYGFTVKRKPVGSGAAGDRPTPSAPPAGEVLSYAVQRKMASLSIVGDIPYSPDSYNSKTSRQEPTIHADNPNGLSGDDILDASTYAPEPASSSRRLPDIPTGGIDRGHSGYMGEGQWDISEQLNAGYSDSVYNSFTQKKKVARPTPQDIYRKPQLPPKVPLGMTRDEYYAAEPEYDGYHGY